MPPPPECGAPWHGWEAVALQGCHWGADGGSLKKHQHTTERKRHIFLGGGHNLSFVGGGTPKPSHGTGTDPVTQWKVCVCVGVCGGEQGGDLQLVFKCA